MIHPELARRLAGRRAFAAIAARGERRRERRLLTVCTGTRDAEDQWRRHPDNGSARRLAAICCEELEAVLALAEAHDVLIGIEPELGQRGELGRRAPGELLDALGSERLRIVLDPANLFDVAGPDECRRHRRGGRRPASGPGSPWRTPRTGTPAGRVRRGRPRRRRLRRTSSPRCGAPASTGRSSRTGCTEAEAPEVASRLRALVDRAEATEMTWSWHERAGLRLSVSRDRRGEAAPLPARPVRRRAASRPRCSPPARDGAA